MYSNVHKSTSAPTFIKEREREYQHIFELFWHLWYGILDSNYALVEWIHQPTNRQPIEKTNKELNELEWLNEKTNLNMSESALFVCGVYAIFCDGNYQNSWYQHCMLVIGLSHSINFEYKKYFWIKRTTTKICCWHNFANLGM